MLLFVDKAIIEKTQYSYYLEDTKKKTAINMAPCISKAKRLKLLVYKKLYLFFDFL